MTDKDLRQTLIRMADEDQAMRDAAIKHGEAWDGDMDKRHVQQLEKIISTYGWPTIPRVGVGASNAAWLIAQHADHDRVFQKKCLALLKVLPDGAISQHNIAYLEDRILLGEGKPQLYGTQFQGTGKDVKPQPIKDEAHVEERRKAIGLNTLAEYKQMLLDLYENPSTR